jgi:hypothetical protein
MSTLPPGYGTIGPIYEAIPTKDKFIEVCKGEGKTMEAKLKELIKSAILSKFPDFAFPEEVPANV